MASKEEYSKQRRYRKLARRAYRGVILVCILALICAVLIWYVADTSQ
ncbi:hypothetical protein ACT6NV_03880 [Robiginitalea sp. IMCC44478]